MPEKPSYNDKNHELKNRFSLLKPFAVLSDTVVCYSMPFKSDCAFEPRPVERDLPDDELQIVNESGRILNREFQYAILTPIDEHPKDIILLLHGLNERSWEKYLLWAHTLVEKTRRAVILFPIAFHINRAPANWSNPRMMQALSQKRQESNNEIRESSFANVALSLRMQYNPEMFPVSGAQSYLDIIKLCRQIKTGNHPLLQKTASISIFAYSIGTILAKILILANPFRMFSKERVFLFCGGAYLEQVNPVSRAIMDSDACKTLKSYLASNPKLAQLMASSRRKAKLLPQAWKIFQYLISSELNKSEKNEILKKVGNRIMAVGLSCDQVFPPASIHNFFGNRSVSIQVPYSGSHEKPFPFDSKESYAEVVLIFEKVFSMASEFLTNKNKRK
ncbi:MAG TPA: DUF6051 family protein [Bacteroidales bacterium]|nr:DUF6051 family protein [Bacteroidales bacterium]